MARKFLIVITGLVIALNSFAQNYYRISGEFSIKSKSENAAQLIIGNFYYDKNIKSIVHDNFFPEKEKWITTDTSLYLIIDDAIVSRQTIPDFTDFSIYNMVLNNKLDNFGLEESMYDLEEIEQQGDMVITTWMPPKKVQENMGKIMISTKNNNMYGIIFFGPDEEIMKKQFFEDYSITGGLAFPGKIVEITYKEGKEFYQVTTYKNIKVNDTSNEERYHFKRADYKFQE